MWTHPRELTGGGSLVPELDDHFGRRRAAPRLAAAVVFGELTRVDLLRIPWNGELHRAVGVPRARVPRGVAARIRHDRGDPPQRRRRRRGSAAREGHARAIRGHLL